MVWEGFREKQRQLEDDRRTGVGGVVKIEAELRDWSSA